MEKPWKGDMLLNRKILVLSAPYPKGSKTKILIEIRTTYISLFTFHFSLFTQKDRHEVSIAWAGGQHLVSLSASGFSGFQEFSGFYFGRWWLRASRKLYKNQHHSLLNTYHLHLTFHFSLFTSHFSLLPYHLLWWALPFVTLYFYQIGACR